MVQPIPVHDFCIGEKKLTIIAGPCSLESLELGLEIGEKAKEICHRLGMNYIFKASYDKANRTSIHSYRGPGLEKGLSELAEIKEKLSVPVLTDIHESWQAEPVAEVADILQIPAFLCRQTDLLVAAAQTHRPLHVKKAQFLAPHDMKQVVEKCKEAGNDKVILCERGTTMGYNQLVVDMRSLVLMRNMGCPVIFDATHSVQMPGGKGTSSGGDRRFALPLARAAAAIGIDGLFIETHPDPSSAKSDGPNMVPLKKLEYFLSQIGDVWNLVENAIGKTDIDWAEEA
jgi:2-dehydro-3-deoxyphosphooctonate aldolase (KDO 8-P synthase)